MTLVTSTGEQVYDAFYGGAAGGGKSEALLMGAAQYVEVPGYSALLLRRTYPDLSQPGALLDRSKEWWGHTAAKWNAEQKEWRFPAGSVIRFGHMENLNAINNYYGSEYQFIGFDEATQFVLEMVTKMFARLRRRRHLPVPLRMRMGSNPGGIGHEWVKQRYLIDGPSEGRVFVPANVIDNPTLDYDEYVRSLNELDPVTRAQLLEGDWDVAGAGANFKRDWFRIVAEAPVEFSRLVRYWDTASTAPSLTATNSKKEPDWTVGILMGRTPDQRYYILSIVRFQGTPRDVQQAIANTAYADRMRYGDGNVEIYMEQEPGASGKSMIETYTFNVLAGYYFQGRRSTGSKPVRAAAYSSMAQARNVFIVAQEGVAKFLDEHEAFPFGSHDDQVDAAAGAFNELTIGGELRPAGERTQRMFSYRG